MALRALNSVAGFSVGETPANVILGNADVLANNLSVNGISNLNSLTNVKISGGSAGQFIQTDGAGNLVFASPGTQSSLANGTSNVSIPVINGNINLSVGGNPNVLVATTTGIVVTGSILPSSNITYDLGNSTRRFKDLWLSGTTIQLGNSTVQANATDIILTNPLGGQFLVTGTGISTSNTIADGTSNLNVGSSGNVTITVAGNANVLTVTGTGVNVTGYLTSTGNLTVGNANLGNLATANFVNVSSNINVTNTMQAGNVRTDNLLYANGVPWDLQEAAGANYEIQYNIDDNFAASANFTYNDSTQQFTVLGNGQFNNANLGNLATANYINVASNVITGNLTVNNSLTINTANFSGNLVVPNLTVNSELAGNTANFSGNVVVPNLTVNLQLSGNTANFSGNVVVPNLTVNLELQANTANFDGNVVMDKWLTVANTANVGNLRTDNLLYANGQPWDLQQPAGSNTQIQYNNNNDFGASANFTFDSVTNNLALNGNILLGSANKNQIVSPLANVLEIRGGFNDPDGIVAMATGDYANSVNWGKIAIYGNLGGNATAQLEANIINFQQGGGGANIVKIAPLANAASSTTTGAIRVAGGIGVTGNGYFGGNVVVTGNVSANSGSFSGNVVANNATVNLELAGNTANFSGNVVVNNSTVNLELAGNTANFSGNVVVPNLTVNLELAGNTANFSGNIKTLNANLGNLATANFVNVASNIITNNLTVNLALVGNTANFSGNVIVPNLQVNLELAGNTANFTGNVSVSQWLNVSNTAAVANLRTDNLLYANGQPWDLQQAAGANYEIQFNIDDDFAASPNLQFNNSTQTLTVNGNANITGAVNTPSINAGSGNNFAVTANGQTTYFYANGNVTFPGTVNAGTFSGNFSGSFTAAGSNTQILFNDAGNVNGAAGFTYNKLTNAVSITGNLTAPNFIGALANGNSNITVYGNSNVEVSIAGTSNVVAISTAGIFVAGNINSTSGNITSNGNVTANGTLIGGNANVTGETRTGSVLTANITAPTGNITISAAGTNENIILNPSGTGVIDVGLHRVTNVADPQAPHDATTKEYVDNLAVGLTIHTPVRVVAATNLNATYANGGSVLTTIAITGNKTIQFGAAHGLSIGDEISWDNSFNGIIGNDPYFVYSTPASDTITVKAGFYGAEVTTLTNGSSLSQTARANTGVGATLTNAGANAAISIDGESLSTTNRVLVIGQTNQAYNGVYTVTTVGAPDSPGPGSQWVLTRATTEDTYGPRDNGELGYGDYFFVLQGTSYAGSSYVLTSPIGEILFGYTNIGFTQFADSTVYSAGSGIDIIGTTISANTDGITTDIVSGNIVVKSSANLTTPNIGDATFSSLTWNNLSNGNISANNLSIGNVANISSNLTVGGNIFGNYAIAANGNVSGANVTTTGNVQAQGNILANNITANSVVNAANANVSGTTITNALTVNNAITGNTANFSGNVVTANLSVNSYIVGNLANFSGNVILPNLTVNLELVGNTANFSGNVKVNNLGVNLELAGNTANFTGNLAAANISTAGNLTVTGVANINTSLILGNNTVTTKVSYESVTTSSITPDQTIASFVPTGVTGIEFLVKGIDSSGSKYSVATVQAVTDGTSVDYATYGTVNLGGYLGTLSVNIVSGYIRLQVTPASSNSTVWTTQYRLI